MRKRLRWSLNPVLVKELRGRMRGPRAYLLLTGTLALLGLVSYGLYRLALATTQNSYGGTGSSGAIIGQSVFLGLMFIALLVICAIAPSLTAGAISSEHERKTYDMLLATPLRPSAIVLGKLAVSLSYTGLILLATVPLVSLSYVFGGVATIDMLQAFLMLLGFALTFNTIGLFFSALFRRTTPAILASFIVLAFFVIGSVFVYALAGVMGQQQPPVWLLALNPFSALASALANPTTSNIFSLGGGFAGPLMGLLYVLSGNSFDPSLFSASGPLWHYTMGIYIWLTVTLYLASTHLVKPVRRRAWRRTGIIVALYLGATYLATLFFYGPFTPQRIIAWIRWQTATPLNLVANGKFDEPLESTWQVSTEAEHPDSSGGEVQAISEEGRTLLRLSRAGGDHAETRLTQLISHTLSTESWLQVRVTLRVRSDDLYLCGIFGSECPLMIKLAYRDATGRPHEWVQGLNAETLPIDSAPYPDFCTTCETAQPLISVPPQEWYTYESSNLLQELPLAIAGIDSITLAAGGHTYETDVAEVALLVREGRPPDFGNGTSNLPSPPPVPMFGPGMRKGSLDEVVPIALLLPTALAPTRDLRSR
ncbi:MAG TPA: ABC transporter permease subunit [Anaerolineae bacterium]|nr:ABC transporter permease subunit [Anaerolineae bacterium]